MAMSTFEAGERDVLLAVHTRNNPSKEEWDRYLQMTQALIDKTHGSYVGLAVTDGGGPNSGQRAALVPIAKQSPNVRGAAVTNSVFVRGIMTALSWVLNPNFKAFAPDELQQAVAHLELSAHYLPKIKEEIAKLQTELPSIQTVQALLSAPYRRTG